MLISTCLANPKAAWLTMERLVNDGSPSGFTEIHATSDETNPQLINSYNLWEMRVLEHDPIQIGVIPTEFTRDSTPRLYIHPDYVSNGVVSRKKVETSISVVPLSSARTVYADGTIYSIKMSYPGMLGRLERIMEEGQLRSAIEVSTMLGKMIGLGLAPKFFDYTPKIGGIVYKENSFTIGNAYRADAICTIEHPNEALIPAFSLIAKNNQGDLPILYQILNNIDNKIEWLRNQLIIPLLDCFFACGLNAGLVPEMHAQNVLIQLDEKLNITHIIIRDLESIEKDIGRLEDLGYNTCFASCPYKCLSRDDTNYYRKHSFMYDHKLGEYLLEPIMLLVDYYGINSVKLREDIRQYVRAQYIEYIESYYPIGKWYKYPVAEIDRTSSQRKYIEFDNPPFR